MVAVETGAPPSPTGEYDCRGRKPLLRDLDVRCPVLARPSRLGQRWDPVRRHGCSLFGGAGTLRGGRAGCSCSSISHGALCISVWLLPSRPGPVRAKGSRRPHSLRRRRPRRSSCRWYDRFHAGLLVVPALDRRLVGHRRHLVAMLGNRGVLARMDRHHAGVPGELFHRSDRRGDARPDSRDDRPLRDRPPPDVCRRHISPRSASPRARILVGSGSARADRPGVSVATAGRGADARARSAGLRRVSGKGPYTGSFLGIW